MNLKETMAHNIKCWKSEIEEITLKINFLKGKREGLEETVECLEIILKEQENPT